MSRASTWTFADGAFRPDALIPATDRGLRYGMSVFETIGVIRGRPLFLAEHLLRLKAACRAAGFLFPEEMDLAALSALIQVHGTGMLRLYVSAGDGGPTDAVTGSRTFAIYEDTAIPGDDEISPGWRLGLSRVAFPCVLGGWKTGNYWLNVQALAEAKKQGFQEAILLNAQGALTSASMGNLFVVINGRILTPSLSMGARDGVVRAWVMAQTPVEEAVLSVEDLATVEECFLTNSRIGVMPVAAIEEKSLDSSETSRKLAWLYREKILSSR